MIAVRNATVADASASWLVRTLAIRDVCRSAYGPEDIEAWQSTPMPADFGATLKARLALVAVDAGRVIGVGFLSVDAGELESLFVHPGWIGRGVGRRLLAALEELAREAGIAVLRLSSSLNAVPFYETAGYVARKRTRFQHPRGFTLECVDMDKRLPASASPASGTPRPH